MQTGQLVEATLRGDSEGSANLNLGRVDGLARDIRAVGLESPLAQACAHAARRSLRGFHSVRLGCCLAGCIVGSLQSAQRKEAASLEQRDIRQLDRFSC